MAFFRDPKQDNFKNPGQMHIEKDLKCTVPGCCEGLTEYEGPGQSLLCRPHQLKHVRYGQMGNLKTLYSFHKKWSCDWCGWSPLTDERFNNIEWDDEVHKNIAMRSTLIADHITRRADGGTDEENNIQSLCQICNTIKTVYNRDYTKKKIQFICEEVDAE
jgi:5-methylcytosine-specific restriction endonuclease McrA